MPSYKFIAAAVIALCYVIAALCFVRSDRKPHGGNFISLPGMGSFLATMPVSAPLEWCGHKIDYRSNWEMGFVIAACASVVFGLALGSMTFAGFLWSSARALRPT